MDAKLTGFDYSRLQQQILSLRWTAPEKLKRNFVPYSKKCDIYGFSITLMEFGTRKKPFEEMEDDIDVVDYVVKDGKRPTPFPTDGPKEYNELIMQSWSAHAGTRPTIEVMREKLHKLTKQCQKYYDNPSTDSVLQNIDTSNSSISQSTSQSESSESTRSTSSAI